MESFSQQSASRDDVRIADDASFRAFVDTVRDYAMFMLDTTGRVISWNRGAQLIKGYSAEEITGRHFSVFYPPEAIERKLPQHELVMAEKEGRFEDEGWRLRKDGSRFWANVVITAMRSASGKLIGFAKVTRDLSERRKHEESLRISETRFRALVEGVRDYAIFMLDPGGGIASWNAGAQQIHGFDANEIIGRNTSTLMVADDGTEGDIARRQLTAAASEGRFQEENWRIRKGGSRFWANVVITAIRDRSGVLLGYSQIVRDLTERRRHEAALRESEERFRLLVDSVIDYAISTLDQDGMITSWNSGAEKITGYRPGEIVGRHFSRLYPPEEVRANKPWRQLSTARERGRVYDESWRIRKDGTQFWANNVIATLPAAEGRPRAYYMVTQDLTQRRHAETLADTAQHMHEFIAMLAHELRNPLAPIRNAVALMGRRGITDPVIEAMRMTIDRQSVMLTRIVDELLDVNRVARGQLTMEKEHFDLRDVIQRAVETSGPLIDAHTHNLHLAVPDVPIDCLIDPMRMSQVIVNILNNAAKYTPDGGDIWLAAATVGGQVELRVRDNGRGIERDSIDRVFDLFMQADPNNGMALGGLGVGLALVRRIVELHGGRVQAASDGLERGSEFIVRLPCVSRSADTPEPPAGTSPPAHDQFEPLRLLVVDDNQDAANSMTLLMKSMGHEVRTAFDGPAGLAIAQEFKPEAAFLDIGMPVMNGYEMARALRSAPDRCTLVAVTGWDHDAARRQARDAGFDHHLVKPVAESALIGLLATVSADRSASR
jgi:PAS domain S-box-containing protein